MHIILSPITGWENLAFGVYERSDPIAEAELLKHFFTRKEAYDYARALVAENANVVVEDHIKTAVSGEPTSVFVFYPDCPQRKESHVTFA